MLLHVSNLNAIREAIATRKCWNILITVVDSNNHRAVAYAVDRYAIVEQRYR